MPLLALILTFPLVYTSYNKNHEKESFYYAKLAGIWLTCQFYVIINNQFRFPFGLLCAFLMSYYSKRNKLSKLIAFGTGLVSFLISCLVYLLYKL